MATRARKTVAADREAAQVALDAVKGPFKEWAQRGIQAGILPEISLVCVDRYFDSGHTVADLGVDPNTIDSNTVVVLTGAVDDSGSMEEHEQVVPRLYNANADKTMEDMGKSGDPIITTTVFFNGGIWHPYKNINLVPFMTDQHYSPNGDTPLYRTARDVLDMVIVKCVQIIGADRQPISVTYGISDGMDADNTYHAQRVKEEDVAAIAQPLLSKGPHILAAAALGGTARNSFIGMGWPADWISSDDGTEQGLDRVFQRVRRVSSGASQAGGAEGIAKVRQGGFQ